MSAHDDEIHLPEPSAWPFFLALSIPFLPVGALLYVSGTPGAAVVLAVGTLLTVLSGFGWAGSVIAEKHTLDLNWGNRVLSMAWKLFLISEAAIFAAFFGHYGYMVYHAKPGHWPPEGTPEIHLMIPTIGFFILVTSSVTIEFAHKALLVGRRGLAKSWLVLTILLGLAFISLQGYEWGHLQTYGNFFPSTNVAGTLFYLITGFHGGHVITGLLLLFLVYVRLESGSFTKTRHFAFNAASWYWHFVDVIWFFVFLILYLGIQVHE